MWYMCMCIKTLSGVILVCMCHGTNEKANMQVLLFIAVPVSACSVLKSMQCVSVCIHFSRCFAQTFATGEQHVNEPLDYRAIIMVSWPAQI